MFQTVSNLDLGEDSISSTYQALDSGSINCKNVLVTIGATLATIAIIRFVATVSCLCAPINGAGIYKAYRAG